MNILKEELGLLENRNVKHTLDSQTSDPVGDGIHVGSRDISECIFQVESPQSVLQDIPDFDYPRGENEETSAFPDIVGNSPALKRTLAQVEAVAAAPLCVLIEGESGVGKEGIAQAIHDHSDRADGPLVKVNCASISAELFESEIFGHVKGAFTGAHRDRVGRMQLADGGTLFLDEVAEVPIELQAKLLRALQEREFERVGDHTTIRVDVRIVAATNRNLAKEIEAGKFREDLFYRLSVFPIDVPPLRTRKEDLAQLAHYFVTGTCEELGRPPLPITKQHLSMLEAHDWPGNIRELKNVIERSIVLSSGSRLRLDLVLTPPEKPVQEEAISGEFLTEEELRDLEKNNLLAALNAADWQVSGTGGVAEMMGLKPSTVAYRMKTFGIEKPSSTS